MTSDKNGSEGNARKTVNEVASEWLAYLYSDDVTADGQARFEAWLQEAPGHAEAFQRADQIWRDLALVDAEQPLVVKTERTAQTIAFRPKRRVVALIGGAVAACLALVASVSFLVRQSAPPTELLQAEYTTGVGEIRTVTLADGSSVTLDTASEIAVTIGESERVIVLKDGRAFFDVVSDPSRPFIVKAGIGEARALGTEFTVFRFGDALSVAVLEGKVAVRPMWGGEPDANSDDTLVLQAGELVTFQQAAGRLNKEAFAIAHQREWLAGRLSYLDQPLSAVVRDLNRYRENPIIIGDDSLNTLPITLSLKVDQADQFVSGLEATQPVQAQNEAGQVTLYPKAHD